MDPSIITQEAIREWLRDMEAWLPEKINGVCSPNEDTLTRYRYIPFSARLEEFEVSNDNFPNAAKTHVIISYQVERLDVIEGEFTSDYLHGAIAIPIEENQQLRLSDTDPLDGILDLVEVG